MLTRLSFVHSRIPAFTRARFAPLMLPGALLLVLTATACADEHASGQLQDAGQRFTASSGAARAGTLSDTTGVLLTVADTAYMGTFHAAGIAHPLEEATLSTTLMGTVTDVLVHEGDLVRAGQVLLRIDAGELAARAQRLTASVADADALYRDAETQARRFAALYADSAATRAQSEAAQTGLARADAAVRAARAAAAELEAASRYATLRAPFDGMVVRRSIDRGGMAAPGAPLLTIQSARTLRITATAPAEATRRLQRGQRLTVTIGTTPAIASIEGVVPSGSSNLFTVNALVANANGQHAAGTSATLQLPTDSVRGIMLPTRALVRDGDLVGVIVDQDGRREPRWIRLGETMGDRVEVTSGIRVGDRVVMPRETRTRTRTGGV